MTTQFTFSDLPVDPIDPGKTILVSGSGRMASEVAKKLSFEHEQDDGAVYVTTNTSGRQFAADIEADYPAVDLSRVGIIDASGRRDVDTQTAARIEAVGSTSDLTGISIKNSILSTHLQKAGVERVRYCLDSLSMLLLYTNFKTITRFVHTIDGRVAATDGLGVFVLDDSMHDPQVRHTLKNFCDFELSVRRGDSGAELRVMGRRRHTEWQPFDLY